MKKNIEKNARLLDVLNQLKSISSLDSLTHMGEAAEFCFETLKGRISGVIASTSDDSWDDRVKTELKTSIDEVVVLIENQKKVAEKIKPTTVLVKNLHSALVEYKNGYDLYENAFLHPPLQYVDETKTQETDAYKSWVSTVAQYESNIPVLEQRCIECENALKNHFNVELVSNTDNTTLSTSTDSDSIVPSKMIGVNKTSDSGYTYIGNKAMSDDDKVVSEVCYVKDSSGDIVGFQNVQYDYVNGTVTYSVVQQTDSETVTTQSFVCSIDNPEEIVSSSDPVVINGIIGEYRSSNDGTERVGYAVYNTDEEFNYSPKVVSAIFTSSLPDGSTQTGTVVVNDNKWTEEVYTVDANGNIVDINEYDKTVYITGGGGGSSDIMEKCLE